MRPGAPPDFVTWDRFLSSASRSEEHTSELQSQSNLVCRLLLEKKSIPLRRIVAHRLRKTELGELGRTKVVDHPAHRIERAFELHFEIRQLGAKGLPHFAGRTLV